ncbi:transposase family protein [Nocardia pneumoniae]|uniref:transposase family protein n=1 Tax=Nocardia pneumoniae TaxID=228601 RepID=UPI0009FB9804
MSLRHLVDLVIVDVRRDRNVVTIEAAVAAGSGSCPRCGSDSVRVHSWYWRQLADVSIAGSAVVLRLRFVGSSVRIPVVRQGLSLSRLLV